MLYFSNTYAVLLETSDDQVSLKGKWTLPDAYFNWHASVLECNPGHTALFKRLSKVITPLRLISLVIGSRMLCRYFNQRDEKKTKTNRTLYARFFPRLEHVSSNC